MDSKQKPLKIADTSFLDNLVLVGFLVFLFITRGPTEFSPALVYFLPIFGLAYLFLSIANNLNRCIKNDTQLEKKFDKFLHISTIVFSIFFYLPILVSYFYYYVVNEPATYAGYGLFWYLILLLPSPIFIVFLAYLLYSLSFVIEGFKKGIHYKFFTTLRFVELILFIIALFLFFDIVFLNFAPTVIILLSVHLVINFIEGAKNPRKIRNIFNLTNLVEETLFKNDK